MYPWFAEEMCEGKLLLKVALVQIRLHYIRCLTRESALTPNPFLKYCDVTAHLEI